MKKTIFEQLRQAFLRTIKFGVKRGERILKNAEKRYTKDQSEPNSSAESAPDLCRPIGSTFVVDGAVLEVVENAGCGRCYFNRGNAGCSRKRGDLSLLCLAHDRSDHKWVIFKKVGKAATKNIIADLTKANISDIRELSQMFDKSLYEAEYCHEEETKGLIKAHISDIRELSRRFDEALDVRLKIEREKAKDAFCDLCMGKCPIGVSCEKLDRFIQKIKH